MTAVMDDPRVTPRGDGFTVDRSGSGDGSDVVVVMYRPPFNWTICTGPNLDFLPVGEGVFAIGYPTAEVAVRVALA